ncbi:hypothetical protein [Negativicoccus succinicivorans]|uniref:hypothetical protein n=1 Tax=Negativicoccus succinicivorans TaxID=620903 RepID=UPI002903D1EF|nr:hypothetical protein [Negativicoccus succinicivorans]MDU2418061.1 hypothetical protein [Negativicoccus succinicivorans]
MRKEVETAIKLYDDTFADTFPTIPLLRDMPDDEVIEMINKCVAEGKDVYEMGYLSLDIYY